MLELVGGLDYLNTLLTCAADGADLDRYARIVAQMADQRATAETGSLVDRLLPRPTPSHYATRQHMELIAAKRDQIEAALLVYEEQYVVEVKRDWDAGILTVQELQGAYSVFKKTNLPGSAKRWTGVGLPSRQKLDSLVWAERNPRRLPDLCWEGGWGRNPGDDVPWKDQSVVYYLYDEQDLVYIGSTQSFVTRLEQHRKDKTWTRWTAWPCPSREDAYRREDRYLKYYLRRHGCLPRFNRKPGR